MTITLRCCSGLAGWLAGCRWGPTKSVKDLANFVLKLLEDPKGGESRHHTTRHGTARHARVHRGQSPSDDGCRSIRGQGNGWLRRGGRSSWFKRQRRMVLLSAAVHIHHRLLPSSRCCFPWPAASPLDAEAAAEMDADISKFETNARKKAEAAPKA